MLGRPRSWCAQTLFLCSALFPFLPGSLSAQTNPVTASDPNAVALAGKALQALAGGTALTDVTFQATANYTAGSDQESGTATLVARANTQSLVALNLSNGQRKEIRDGPAGAWTGNDGTAHAMALQNCFTDADWFYPAFSLEALANDPTLVISLVGLESRAGEPVYHLVLFHYLSGQLPDMMALAQRLSLINLYLDASSLLPVALDFNVYADKDANIGIPVEIRFGVYKSFNGTWAPTRIQKYLQNSLALDLTVGNVAVNSGVPAGLFTLPSIPSGGGQ